MKFRFTDEKYHSRIYPPSTDLTIQLSGHMLRQNVRQSGLLLKRLLLRELQKIDIHWYPMKMNYKDVLKNGKGTDFIIMSIEFDIYIPEYIFGKAALKQ